MVVQSQGLVLTDEFRHALELPAADIVQRALENVIDVVWAAGGQPRDIARMVVYVTDKAEYTARSREIGEVWRARMGRHYPAMALVEVKGLVERGALLEIEATAVIGGTT